MNFNRMNTIQLAKDQLLIVKALVQEACEEESRAVEEIKRLAPNAPNLDRFQSNVSDMEEAIDMMTDALEILQRIENP